MLRGLNRLACGPWSILTTLPHTSLLSSCKINVCISDFLGFRFFDHLLFFRYWLQWPSCHLLYYSQLHQHAIFIQHTRNQDNSFMIWKIWECPCFQNKYCNFCFVEVLWMNDLSNWNEKRTLKQKQGPQRLNNLHFKILIQSNQLDSKVLSDEGKKGWQVSTRICHITLVAGMFSPSKRTLKHGASEW